MGIIDNLLEESAPKAAPQSPAWIQELINNRSGTAQPRKKRNPVGFNFTRDPFDPSSYYKQLGSFRDISKAATAVTQVEVANREEKELQKAWEESQNALKGVNPEFTYGPGGGGGASGNWSTGKGRNYKLGGVTSNTGNAANYWGSKYGIKTIGGYREHGSVPGSDHPKGRALDFMINNVANGKSRGTALANDLIKNYKSWNIKYVIWNRYIWSPSRGWRRYNGPSPHTDHVHASFNK